MTAAAKQITPLGIGMIGCGNVSGAYLAAIDRLRAEKRARLVAVCGREHQRTAMSFDGHDVFFTTDVQELVDRGDVDVVLVLTPMHTHAAFAKQALAAGKHVLVEKPLAVTRDEADDLLACAAVSPGYLMAAPFTPLSPTARAMRARVVAGELGQVTVARARYGWAGPDWNAWFYQQGGGALFDLAVYNVTTLVALLGPVTAVTAMTGIAIPERNIQGRQVAVTAEDNAQVAMEHASGTLSVITSGFTMQQYRSPAIELYGTEGTLQMLGDDWDPDGYELWRATAGAWEVYKETDPEWPWTDGLRALLDAIAVRQPPALTPAFAHHVLDVLLQARAAARSGCRQPVTSRCVPPHLPPLAAKEGLHLVHDRARRLAIP